MDAIRALQQQLMEARGPGPRKAAGRVGRCSFDAMGKNQVFSLREFLDFDFLGLDHVSDKRNV